MTLIRTLTIAVLLAALFQLTHGLAQEELRFPELRGTYLGQKLPGSRPELFAPGIISTDATEGCSGWGREGEFFVFQRFIDERSILFLMTLRDGLWGNPEPIAFSHTYQIGDFAIAPDGRVLVFASRIPIAEVGPDGEGGNIWYVEKTDTGWTEPTPFRHPINTKYHDSYPYLAGNRNLYFFSRRPGGLGDSDLYVSLFRDGQYEDPINLGETLNTSDHEWDPCVAPDESFMVFCSTKPGGLGEDDLYVAFRSDDGSWSTPVHMGNSINSPKSENRPYLSPDGKVLFFASTRGGNRDIFWVSAEVIETFRPPSFR